MLSLSRDGRKPSWIYFSNWRKFIIYIYVALLVVVGGSGGGDGWLLLTH